MENQDNNTHLLILLSFVKEFLSEISKEQTVVGLWLKLEKFFIMKTTYNKLLYSNHYACFVLTYNQNIYGVLFLL